LAVMPAISKSRLQTAPSVYKPHIQTALKLSTLLSFAATIGIILLFPEVNTLLFKNDAGDVALRLLMLAIGLSSVPMTMLAIIQGLGYVKRTAVYIAGAFLLKWCLNLLFVPIWGLWEQRLRRLWHCLHLPSACIIRCVKHLNSSSH